MIDFPQIPCFVTHLPNSKGRNPSLSETMCSKNTQVHILGIFNTTKVGNACFVIVES